MLAPGTNGRRPTKSLSPAENAGLKRRRLLKVPIWTDHLVQVVR